MCKQMVQISSMGSRWTEASKSGREIVPPMSVVREVTTFNLMYTHQPYKSMEILQLRLPWLLQSLLLVLLLRLAVPVSAVYFYIENASPKCFYEELPKDTIVVGKCHP